MGRAGYKALCANRLYRACARGLTFCWFAFTLFWFWSDWHQIGQIVTALGIPMLGLIGIIAVAGATLALTISEVLRSAVLDVRWADTPVVTSRYVRTVFETALLVVTIAVVVLLNAPAPDIVYKAF